VLAQALLSVSPIE